MLPACTGNVTAEPRLRSAFLDRTADNSLVISANAMCRTEANPQAHYQLFHVVWLNKKALKEKGCLWFTAESEREREREREHTGARETTIKRQRTPGSRTCSATARESTAGPWVPELGQSISLVPWISASLDRLKAKSEAEGGGSCTPGLHTRSLSHPVRLPEGPARAAQEVLPSNK